MSEADLQGSCDWAVRSCDQLLLQPSTGDLQMEDSTEANASGERPESLHSSCLPVEPSPEVTPVPFPGPGTPMMQNATETCKSVSGFPEAPQMSHDSCCHLEAPQMSPDSCSRLETPQMSHNSCNCLEASSRLELTSNTENDCEMIVREPAPISHEGISCRTQKGGLSCPICHHHFKSASELKEHFRDHPPVPQVLRCWQSGCAFTAQNIKRFQSHVRREHRMTPVTCSHRSCRLMFPSREEMSQHFRSHFPFHCVHCDFVSSNTKLFSQHQKSHSRDEESFQSSDSVQPLPVTSTTAEKTAVMPRGSPRQSDEGAHLSPATLLKGKKPGRTPAVKGNEATPESNGEEETQRVSVHKRRTRGQSIHTGKDKALTGIVENGKEQQFKTFMCPECKRCFKKRTHLADHLHLHFPDPNLQCPNCLKYFTSRSKLKIHMMREAGEKTHRCPLCDYSSVEKNALNRHMASIHEGVSNFYSDTYSCPVCQETFKMSQALKEHMKGHTSEPKLLFCFEPTCDQAFSDRKDFLRHMKECHGVQALECRYHACSMLFKSRDEMEEHRKNHYAFHCQDCDFVCSNKHVFRKHKKRGHPGKEELACRFCPYKSFNPVEYTDHVGKMHANEKIHRCGDCDFATAHKRVLIRHMLLHTGEKPHKCSQCEFVCRDLSYLSKHVLTHSADKNYMCTDCGYVTKWKHYLTVHMRKHSGDLRYHCSQCSYRCHRADQLSSHKLRHQGKTLICEVCGFGCKRKSELQKHVLIKHSQSAHVPLYQCQHCNYQTRYKQTLRNHENGKHTKHREFRCALCAFRTFSNTSLFFHKRKSHGYVPGDKAWLERYARKQKEANNTDLLFPFKTGMSIAAKLPFSGDKHFNERNCGELDGFVQESLDGLQVEPHEDANMSVAEESLLAAISLEPVETCSIEMEDFPVRLELSTSNELLTKESAEETLVSDDPLPERGEILCFSETLTVEEPLGCGQEFEEETDPQTEDSGKLENTCVASVHYDPEPVMCEIGEQCEDLPLHVNSNLEIQSGDISVEVQESWADMVKSGVQLTIVCESSGLDENALQEEELPTVSLDDAYETSKPESILKALRMQDKEQAETLVLEGRVQMLVVQSKSQVYRCEKCSYITKKKACIVQHAKNDCSMRKSALMCKDCGARFKQQRGLNTHILKKCPVIQKRKRSGLRVASEEDNRHLAGDLVTTVSAEDVIPEEPKLPQNGLEASSQLSSFQDLVQEQFQEIVANGTKSNEQIGQELCLETSGTMDNAFSRPAESDRYRFEGGKFWCLFCSYSCTRECTIICHVNENCHEVERVLCPTVEHPISACQKHRMDEHGHQEKDLGCESSAGEDSQNSDVDEELEQTETNMESAGTCKLSCPTCPFKCSQERAMKTHKKKGCLKPGELQCPLCSFRCMSTAALKRHRDLHQKYSLNRAQLQCKLCDFTCKQPRCLKQHVRVSHDGVKPHRCKYCDFSTTRRYRLEAHESLHTGVGRISCGDCNRTFGTNSKLRLHQRRVHEKNPTHFCSLCDYSGYSQNDIARHLSSCHSGESAFPCNVCQASFSSEAALKQHSLRKHQEKATHQCSKCAFCCHSQATLRCHVQKQHLQLECAICRETFSHRQHLEEHRKSHFSHHCQLCPYAAKDRQQLVSHYAEMHETSSLAGVEGQEGSLSCPFCSFSCRHQLVYDHHVKGHGATRVYKCSDCEYSTRNKQKITWHSRIHTGEKPYKCHLCTYACADPSRLKYHMRIHKDEKNYLCPECGYKCKWVNQLKYHMTKHTGLKPYQCEECEYCTNRADALRVHRETRHRETRSFICEQCGKAFKTRFLLKTHLKKHSEDKPYVCNVCQRGFRWPAGLRHHYLTHTNQQPFFCRHCSYRAKQKFQVVKHIQRHHPNHADIDKGVGKEPYLFSIQGRASVLQQPAECEADTLPGTAH